MARRKTTTQPPEISEETLERARQQVTETAATERAERRARVRKATTTREAGKPRRVGRQNEEKLTPQVIEDRLANPTKFVTEEELRRDYAFVLTDLRNMGLLAAALMGSMVVLALFFIR